MEFRLCKPDTEKIWECNGVQVRLSRQSPHTTTITLTLFSCFWSNALGHISPTFSYSLLPCRTCHNCNSNWLYLYLRSIKCALYAPNDSISANIYRPSLISSLTWCASITDKRFWNNLGEESLHSLREVVLFNYKHGKWIVIFVSICCWIPAPPPPTSLIIVLSSDFKYIYSGPYYYFFPCWCSSKLLKLTIKSEQIIDKT